MSKPFFSVLLFTKNRADLARFALISILCQSFSDFEIVVSDNDDTNATFDTLSSLRDSRVRYHRSGGDLSMADNWENCFSRAEGEYVLSLTDRAVFRPGALERVARAISEFGEDVYVWPHVHHDDRGSADTLYIPEQKPDRVWESAEIFSLFRTNGYTGYTDLLPKSLNSCHSRKLLDKIRNTTGGRICLPICSDQNIGFLTLGHCLRVVALNEPLFVWGGLERSSGLGTYQRTETFRRFLKDLKMTEDDCFNRVPIKTTGIHNMVCNDFLALKSAYPHVFKSFDLDWPHYFANCYNEPALRSPNELVFKEKMFHINTALKLQPRRVRNRVNRILGQRFDYILSQRFDCLYKRLRNKGGRIRRRLQGIVSGPTPISTPREIPLESASRPAKFANILDALEWVEKQAACGHKSEAGPKVKQILPATQDHCGSVKKGQPT